MQQRNHNPLEELGRQGQSVWMDFVDRELITSGELTRLRDEDRLSGITSNPTIFEKAISTSGEYDESIRSFLLENPHADAKSIYEQLAVEDLQQAADLLYPVYETRGGQDGFVSMEVAPDLAHNTSGTIAEARRLWKAMARPNVMIKVPATPEGFPAIEQLISEHINVNITLMFSLDQYVQVARAYIRGLEKCSDPRSISSVASFFVSRVDTKVDRALEKIGTAEALALKGKIAVANSRVVYKKFQEIFGSEFEPLRKRGARIQKPLWASTSTKNPAYRDVLYVEELIGPETINTMPPATIKAFRDHGTVRGATVLEGDPQSLIDRLAKIGVDLAAITDELLEEGIEDFAKSFRNLLTSLDQKKKLLVSQQLDSQSEYSLGRYAAAVEERLRQWKEDNSIGRIWRKDPAVWSAGPEVAELTDRLGWLDLPRQMREQAGGIKAFAHEIKSEDYRHVVLLGMGGSSLAPEVFQATFGHAEGYPELIVADTTHPTAIQNVSSRIDPVKTLFVVSSKSGTTQETLTLFSWFWKLVSDRTKDPGRNFAAITDPGTPLVKTAQQRQFRRTFAAPPEVGGRYSALSVFGLVPAALIGIDIDALLERARQMAEACGEFRHPAENPGAKLGAILGELGDKGCDKITFVTSAAFSELPLWLEQLIAESTGKHDRGLVPVAGERPGGPEVYGKDRLFVGISLAQPNGEEKEKLESLKSAGFPVLQFTLDQMADLGQEFFRWEFATAAAGAVLRINPFDQPDVQLAKDLAKKAMEAGAREAAGTEEELTLSAGPRLGAALRKWTGSLREGDYVSVQAYLAQSTAMDEGLESLRNYLRDRFRIATTVGYGPRFLHSTGQLHKGGPDTGVFLQLTDTPPQDLAVPEKGFTFGRLIKAQAEGDYQALKKRGRRIIRVNLGNDPTTGLSELLSLLR